MIGKLPGGRQMPRKPRPVGGVELGPRLPDLRQDDALPSRALAVVLETEGLPDRARLDLDRDAVRLGEKRDGGGVPAVSLPAVRALILGACAEGETGDERHEGNPP